MEVPWFPEYRDIVLSDKPLFDEAFRCRPPEISAYTFTNVYAWQVPHGYKVSRCKDSLLVRRPVGERWVFLEPIGGKDPVSVALEVIREMGDRAEFERLHGVVASALEKAGLEVSPTREDFDYVYLSSDLIDLPGRKYDAKRNFINRVSALHKWEYQRLTPELACECHDFAKEWCEERTCATVDGLRREQCAVYRMLEDYGPLGIVGGAIRIDGAVVAFALGEALNPQTLVIHVEKATGAVGGLYQLINREFCAHEAREFAFVNREQDLGVPGLRKAKESYHPVRLVETFSVRPRWGQTC